MSLPETLLQNPPEIDGRSFVSSWQTQLLAWAAVALSFTIMAARRSYFRVVSPVHPKISVMFVPAAHPLHGFAAEAARLVARAVHDKVFLPVRRVRVRAQGGMDDAQIWTAAEGAKARPSLILECGGYTLFLDMAGERYVHLAHGDYNISRAWRPMAEAAEFDPLFRQLRHAWAQARPPEYSRAECV